MTSDNKMLMVGIMLGCAVGALIVLAVVLAD